VGAGCTAGPARWGVTLQLEVGSSLRFPWAWATVHCRRCRYYGTRWHDKQRCNSARGYRVGSESSRNHQGCVVGSPKKKSPKSQTCTPVAPCSSCTGSGSSTVCTACATGYFLDSATKQCNACDGSAAQSAAECGVCGAGSTHVCRAAALGGCDVPETCSGTSATCPADGYKARGTECRAAAPPAPGLSGLGGCDVAETCEGTSSLCPDDPGTAGKTCPAQIAALVDLYDSTGGAQWSTSTNWKSGDPCSPSARWYGVYCVPNAADGSYDVV
jgi:hypothetical protein